MATRANANVTIAPELDAIAEVAAERLRAHADDASSMPDLQQRLVNTAIAAINAGATLSAIADAERTGEKRARHDLAPDALRAIKRAGERTREATTAYHQAIARAAKLGLSHRDIATAANLTHSTIRAILTRTNHNTPASTANSVNGERAPRQP